MIQELILALLFLLALAYIGRLLYQSFGPLKGGCPKGCNSCALDLNKLEKQLKEAADTAKAKG
jgi:hypothetical protein